MNGLDSVTALEAARAAVFSPLYCATHAYVTPLSFSARRATRPSRPSIAAGPLSATRARLDSLLLARSLASHPFIADLTATVARRMVHYYRRVSLKLKLTFLPRFTKWPNSAFNKINFLENKYRYFTKNGDPKKFSLGENLYRNFSHRRIERNSFSVYDFFIIVVLK